MLNKLITVGLLLVLWTPNKYEVHAQIPYTRHMSNLRIKELQKLAVRVEHSINFNKHPCDSYYDYVCERRRPVFSVMASQPGEGDIINLLVDLQNDDGSFDAKRKLMNFFVSCNLVKSIADCYRETFDYFRPVFGYIVAAKHIDQYDRKNLLEFLDELIARAKKTEHFATHLLKYKLESLQDKLMALHYYFQVADLNEEYESVQIYNDEYEYNVKALNELRRNNMTYTRGISKAILDWTLYMYQSRNMPMSYYYGTLNVHLWMMFYNSSSRMDLKKYEDIAECLKLPPSIVTLDEARLLAVIYLKSFNNAWSDYRNWILKTLISQDIYAHENEILKQYKLNNKKLFFTLYAQNFCEFGKQLAENVFFLGLKQNQDFYDEYSCGYQTLKGAECV